jgi:DNA ligase (NAD+)
MYKLNNDQIIKNKMKNLINKIRYYDYMYYIKYESIISDTDYDILKIQLEELENSYPHLIEENSPTYTIGFQQNFQLNKSPHNLPMLSLQNTYDLNKVIDFLTTNNLFPIIMEAKIDGISLNLVYRYGYLEKALLRGDGKEGEDVIDHILYTNIPIKIPFENYELVEIRGELYLNNENYNKINKERSDNKLEIFSNPRNGVGSIIRNKKNSYEKFLSFIPYFIKINNQNLFETQFETLKYLPSIGFEEQIYFLCNQKEDINININNFQNLSFNIDGIVFKTNDLNFFDKLGSTQHHPKGAIAYKFTNNHKESKIINVIWQVSRNGKIIPIGEIRPIILEGALIKRITLHNKKYMEINQLNIGSIVLIERVGSTVPQIKKVLVTISNINKISKCPSCNESITEDENNFYCNNINCQEILKEKLYYFFQNINLKGIGIKTIEELVKIEKKIPKILALIIKKTQLNLHGWEKLCFFATEVLKKITPVILLNALGVENLGKKNLQLIFDYMNIKNLHDLMCFLESEYESHLNNIIENKETKIKSIGKDKIKSLINFFFTEKNQVIEIIKILIELN